MPVLLAPGQADPEDIAKDIAPYSDTLLPLTSFTM
eukprot:gene3951-4314_t